MSDSGSAELSALLSQLNTHAVESEAQDDPLPPSPTEAMAMYFVAARLVELQLQRAERDDCDEHDTAITREVLVGTLRMLRGALDRVDERPAGKPDLQIVTGDGGETGKAARRRALRAR